MSPEEPEDRVGPFRRAAVEARDEALQGVGVLRHSPRWLRASSWLLIVVAVGTTSVVCCARVNEYARGPAVVSAVGKRAIVSPVAGSVEAVGASAGTLVTRGQLLVQLFAEAERAEVHRLEAEFETQLARSLLDRADRSAREALIGLRTKLEAAKAALEARTIRAPRAGLLSDVRARVGEWVPVGAPVATLLDGDSSYRIVALLPGAARAELKPGMALRVELSGYPYAYQTVRVTGVGAQVLGPAEAKRLLGAETGDALRIEGPVTAVVAEVADPSFEVDQRTLELHDGMPANASVAVRQVRLVVLLFPWLRTLGARLR